MNRGTLSAGASYKSSVSRSGGRAAGLVCPRPDRREEVGKKANGDKIVFGIVGGATRNSRSYQVYRDGKGVKDLAWVAICDVDAEHVKFGQRVHEDRGP